MGNGSGQQTWEMEVVNRCGKWKWPTDMGNGSGQQTWEMEVVNRCGKWKWPTDMGNGSGQQTSLIFILQINSAPLHIPPACLPLRRTYEIPVIKINTNNQQHKKNERLLLITYKHILASQKYIKLLKESLIPQSTKAIKLI